MDESHRSPAAGGDQAGTPSTPSSLGNPRPTDASSLWAAPHAPAAQPPAPGAQAPAAQPPAAPAAPVADPDVPTGTSDHPRPSSYPTEYPTGQHTAGQHPTGQHAVGPFPAWTSGGASGGFGGHPTTPLGTVPPGDRPGRRRGPLAAAIAGGALVLALVAGGTGAAVGVAVSDHSGSGVTINQESTAAETRSSSTSGTVEAAAATALKSVVTIEVTANSGSGTGSGVVLDSTGHILTNNHVVEAAADGGSITVTLPSGETRTASIVGRDPSSDIAVIKLADASGVTPATFARSSTVRTGQTVLAVGSPLGLSNTVTEGIVSALNRPVRTGSTTDQNTVLDAVQTDAAINPGNSGGALVDLSGRVIGINSAIATVSNASAGGQEGQSGNIGVGFAIPADTALGVAKQLIESGTAEHATLGVGAQDTQNGTGAQIAQVTSGSAADKAGLKTGDVVTAIDDRRVTDTDGLVAAVRSHSPGQSVKVTYQRDGRSSTATATLASSAA